MDLYRLSRRREPTNARSTAPLHVNQFEQIVSIQGTAFPNLSQWLECHSYLVHLI